MVRWKKLIKNIRFQWFLTLSVTYWIYFQLYIYCLIFYFRRPFWAHSLIILVNLWCEVNKAYVEMKWKILNNNVKESRGKLIKYMHEVFYTRNTNYQEKRKCFIPIYVIINYLNLKMIRTEALKKLLKSWKQ